MNWIHMRFGLYMTRRDWVVLCVKWVVYVLAVAGIIAAAIELDAYRQLHDNTTREAHKATSAMKRYESIVLACLRHDIITINGEAKICQI